MAPERAHVRHLACVRSQEAASLVRSPERRSDGARQQRAGLSSDVAMASASRLYIGHGAREKQPAGDWLWRRWASDRQNVQRQECSCQDCIDRHFDDPRGWAGMGAGQGAVRQRPMRFVRPCGGHRCINWRSCLQLPCSSSCHVRFRREANFRISPAARCRHLLPILLRDGVRPTIERSVRTAPTDAGFKELRLRTGALEAVHRRRVNFAIVVVRRLEPNDHIPHRPLLTEGENAARKT